MAEATTTRLVRTWLCHVLGKPTYYIGNPLTSPPCLLSQCSLTYSIIAINLQPCGGSAEGVSTYEHHHTDSGCTTGRSKHHDQGGSHSSQNHVHSRAKQQRRLTTNLHIYKIVSYLLSVCVG